MTGAAGPYIVRHVRDCDECDGSGTICPPELTMLHDVQPCAACARRGCVWLSVKAVADLSSARMAAHEIARKQRPIGDGDVLAAMAKTMRITPEGGTVPLPDGSEIYVEATDLARLVRDVEYAGGRLLGDERESVEVVCAVWNSRSGGDSQ